MGEKSKIVDPNPNLEPWSGKSAAPRAAERWPYEDITLGADHPDVFSRLMTRVPCDVAISLRAIRQVPDPIRLEALLAGLNREPQFKARDAIREVIEFEWRHYPDACTRALRFYDDTKWSPGGEGIYLKALNGDAAAQKEVDEFRVHQLDELMEEKKQARIGKALAAVPGLHRDSDLKKRGPASTGSAMTPAERIAAYRARKKAELGEP